MEVNTNIQHRTPNIQHRSDPPKTALASTLDVRIFRDLLLILLAGLFIYTYRLGNSPLDRTEPFRALVAHQIVNGGDWLVPRLYGEVYLRKPPLIYWIEAGAEKLAGHGSELIWRLPSAVGSALLAVFVAWWAGRWFGGKARLPSGFACLALVALWDQDRAADIDALNTAFAVVTSLCVLELICGLGRNGIGWTLGLGLSLGAMLLLKGPGGLPQVIGAIIGPALVIKSWKLLRSPTLAIGFVIGFAIFATYIVSAKLAMHRAGIPPDPTGWHEIIEKIFLKSWNKRALAWLIPLTLLAYALPVSAALPFAILLLRKMPNDDSRKQSVLAILATLVVTLIIWAINGNDNPRYEYVMLPLLAPVVGFVWSTWPRREFGFDQTLVGVCVLICGADGLVLLKMPHAGTNFVMLIAGLSVSFIAVVGLGVAFARAQKLAAKAASPVVVVLILLFAMTMSERKNAERRKKSAANVAGVFRQTIGGAQRVLSASIVRDMPEIFYYAHVDADSFGEQGVPQIAATHGGHWVVLSEKEIAPIQKQIPAAFPKGIIKLPMPDPRDRIYVGWYDPPATSNTKLDWKFEKPTEQDD